ncbi:MAG: sulfatase [Chloroflexi bacterium]|nr:sulfatase [Chloroflexota bacterium]MBI3168445.1 sulfatase [Chloroflexota bacterium]
MQKKIIIVVIALALLAGAFYTVTNTRLFKDSPNVIIILTDDMDNSLTPYMPKTNQLIGEQGAAFSNYFVTTPLCCPSRASMLRGQYAHNTDILENSPGFARFYKLNEEENTLNVWLHDAGYRTALYGKYLNNYPVNAGRNYIPPGWTDWAAFIANNDDGDFYYNYTMNENGTLVEYGDAPEDYSTDVILDKSLTFIDDSVKADSPFFLFVSVYAPHGPATAAPRHLALDHASTYPQKPSFLEADLSDKPQLIQSLSNTGDEFDAGDANNSFAIRAVSLQAVDELVETLVQTLEQNGQLDNTYIFFVSDNGFHLGEHQLPSGKGTAYEEDIRVPLMVRGPGITPGTQISQVAANIDLAPTIAEIAGISTPDFVDGRSFVPCLMGEEVPWRDGLLIEFGYIDEEAINEALKDPETDNLLMDVAGGAFRGIRGVDYVYVEYANGEAEVYDLAADPYQLENLAGRLSPETLATLHTKLEALKYCEGSDCRNLEEDLEVDIR